MDITSVQEDLDAIKAEYDAKVAEIRDVGLTKLFNSFFEKNPDIKAISFVGYIPGFNDGDPCVFGLGEVNFAGAEVDLNEESPDYSAEDEEYEGWFTTPDKFRYVKDAKGEMIENTQYQGWQSTSDPDYDPLLNSAYLKEPNPNYREDLMAISKFIEGNEDLMNKLFGDNFKVVITPENLTVEEYDCGW